MDIRAGFRLDDPPVLVPWATTQAELRRLLEPHGLREVAGGYYTLSCASLGGLRHELAFRFGSAESDWLGELELFLRPYPGLEASYAELQSRFEAVFGAPTRTSPGSEGFPSHEWRLPGVRIEHSVFGAFGRTEKMSIRRLA